MEDNVKNETSGSFNAIPDNQKEIIMKCSRVRERQTLPQYQTSIKTSTNYRSKSNRAIQLGFKSA